MIRRAVFNDDHEEDVCQLRERRYGSEHRSIFTTESGKFLRVLRVENIEESGDPRPYVMQYFYRRDARDRKWIETDEIKYLRIVDGD